MTAIIDHGPGRLRRVAGTAAAGMLAKSVQLVALVATVPVLYTALGRERYGLWASLTALNALLVFADLGIGNGVTTALGRTQGASDAVATRRIISAAYLSLGGIAGLLGLAGLALLPVLPWARLLGVAGSGAEVEAAGSAIAVLACLVVAVPLGLAARIRLGLQQGHVAALWDAAGQGVALVLVLAGARWSWSVPVLLCAALVPPLAAQALHTAALLWRHPALRPSWQLADRGAVGEVLRTGALFLVIQACTAIAYSFDPLFCSQLYGPAAAADLAVVQRLFAVPTALVALALTPLWPAYGEALARGDRAWVRRTWYRSVAVTTMLVLVAMPCAIWVAPWLLRHWVGGGYTVSIPVVAACAAAAAAQVIAHAVTMLAAGAGRLRGLVLAACFLAALCLAGKPLVGLWLGPCGIILVTAITTVFVYALPAFIAGRSIVAEDAHGC